MVALVTALILALQFGQSASRELRIMVRDSSGLAVQCRVTLVSEANDLSQQIDTMRTACRSVNGCRLVGTGSRSASLASRPTTQALKSTPPFRTKSALR